jgi:1-deoxy-D-xylulose-5-phosphate reductoisomerase
VKRISILGSTGSIGRQTLEVVKSLPERLAVVALAGGENVELLAEQTATFRPGMVSAASAARAKELEALLRQRGVHPLPEITCGPEGMTRAARHPEAEMVVSAAVGVVGLPATYAAIKAGKAIALANKEVLVAAGELVTQAAREHEVDLLPVDSEHNAIHQCLRAGQRSEVRKLILTASGGPFLRTPLAKLGHVTPDEALNHPNWKMGKRITVDSATLVNKGFEVIEAHWLFGMELERIEVVIHRQSIVHSLVEYVDGSVVAQLGPPDMRLPIQYALTYPERMAAPGIQLDWARLRKLEFEAPSASKFPCLGLAQEALRRGGVQPCAFNAADEVAVESFLGKGIRFTDIAPVIESAMERMPKANASNMEDVLAADREARRLAAEEVRKRAGKS